jgi:hypothetical protein
MRICELKRIGTDGPKEMVTEIEWGRSDKGNCEMKGIGTDGTREMVN